MNIKEKIQKLLGLQNINTFIEKNERRIMDLEYGCDQLDQKIDDLESRLDDFDYDFDDLKCKFDDEAVCTSDFEDLELLVERLEKAIKIIAQKVDLESEVNAILENK